MKKKVVLAGALAGAMILGTAMTAQAAPGGWYECDESTITVHVPLGGGSDSLWSVRTHSYDGLELATGEIDDGVWVGTFYQEEVNPGVYSSLEVICSVGDVSYGYYTVDYWVNEAGLLEVTSAGGSMDDYESGSHDAGDDDEDYTPTEPSEFDDPEFDDYDAYAASDLNIRSGPGTNYDVRGYLEQGEKVLVVGLHDGWAMIVAGSETGYVSNNYLTRTAADTEKKEEKTTESKAESTDAKQAEEETPWYELAADGKALTLRVPCDEEAGYSWKFVTSDKTVVDLLTQETSEGKTTVSFADISGEASGRVRVSGEYERNQDGVIYKTYSLDLDVEDGVISLVKERKPWFEVEPETGLMVIRASYNTEEGEGAWQWKFSDESTVELVTQETEDSDKVEGEHTLVASFKQAAEQSGAVMMTLTSEREDGTTAERELRLFVDQHGAVTVLAAIEEPLEAK